ncbi:MAG: hypothetical protein CMJ59_04355 [Planctomycetaceae bacterium]|nr:hypothetical protein [Planctomycetaceae bacterium]
MNGIVLLLSVCVAELPAWQTELDETEEGLLWTIRIENRLLAEWATAGKNGTPHTTRIDLPAAPRVGAERFRIRFGDQPVGGDWIILTADSEDLKWRQRVLPKGRQTGLRIHPSLARRLKFGGYEIRGHFPPGEQPQRQLLIQLTAAEEPLAAQADSRLPSQPEDSRGSLPTPVLRPVTRAPAVDGATADASVPRQTAARRFSDSDSSTRRTADPTGPNPARSLPIELETAGGKRRLLDRPVQERKLGPTPDRLPSMVDPPTPAQLTIPPPAASRIDVRRSDQPADGSDEVGQAGFLEESAAGPGATREPPVAIARFEEPAEDLATRTERSSGIDSPAPPPRQTQPMETTRQEVTASGESRADPAQPQPMSRPTRNPPSHWMLLILGLFASLGLNVFLVINHRSITLQYRRMIAQSSGELPSATDFVTQTEDRSPGEPAGEKQPSVKNGRKQRDQRHERPDDAGADRRQQPDISPLIEDFAGERQGHAEPE